MIAKEYFNLYLLNYEKCNLNYSIESVLQELIRKGINQYILSATNHKDLLRQVMKKNIQIFFKRIIGSDNIHGKSKIENAMYLIEKEKIKKEETLIIGDTLHDYEVAQSIGIKCLLYKNGHQKIEESNNYTIIENMEEIYQFV